MDKILELVGNIKNSPVSKIISQRIKEFESIPRDFNNLFRELAFCILTAGTSAELGIKTIEYLGDVLYNGTLEDIQKRLKEVYRFHTIRAEYIFHARTAFKDIDINQPNVRINLINNIKGLGMKEASHFLRNIGFKDYAIVDFHIIDILTKYELIEKPKTLTPKKYLEIEAVLRELADKLRMSLGELDLYLWYLETGKVLK